MYKLKLVKSQIRARQNDKTERKNIEEFVNWLLIVKIRNFFM